MARIAAFALAVSLGVTAAAGLAVLHAPDAGATRSVRDAIAKVSGDRALASRTLDTLGSAPVAYGAGGLALALFAVALRRRKERGDPDASEQGSTGGASKLDRRLVKKSLKQAHALARKGQYHDAAEILFSCDDFDKAAELFLKAGEPTRAAEIRHDQNRFLEAAELYVEAEDFASAATIFAQQGEFARAADCYLEVDGKSTAAEMFEKAGDFRRAAELYREVEFLRHAAQCYVKCQLWLEAAECLDQVFTDETLKGGAQDPAKQAELLKLVRQAGKLFLRAQAPERALSVLERGRCEAEAAAIAMQLGEYGRASELFKDAGDLEKAAGALQALGETAEAERLLGEHFRSQGDLRTAAEHLASAHDHMAAGDLYRQLEAFAEAGECYARQQEHAQAAEMFHLAGDRVRAADEYERAGSYAQAAECCALSGQGEREAALLEKAGRLLEAGQAYHREGMDDEAITVLQQVTGEGFATASALLADIFRARGQLSLAIKQLRQAIGDAELDRDTLPMFYTLATLFEANHAPVEALEIYEKIMGIDYHHRDVEQRVVRLRPAVQDHEPALTSQGTTSAPTVAVSSQSGRYEIVGELGRGGMGIVYKARDTALDRLVAFKVLPDSLRENPQALRNFFREAKAAAKLNHPNIVTIYDTGEQDGRYYIAMEYVDGTTLKEILRRRGAISPAGVLHVLVQICEALAYAHEKKVVHRDIKTANAMWTRDKKAKIMDFGLAKVVEEVRNHTTVVSGTPYYMSPEQTLGKNVDHRTDIYSLGVTAFELVTGSVPFKEGNIPYHHVHTPAPDVRSIRPEVPEALARIIDRCLAKDADARFQSATEILDAVKASLAS
ncbi:MAG: protein kinase [Myxococcales bacterium]|nr:protein kinase [Myxococcales bacterium]